MIRSADAAYRRGDLAAMLAFVDEDLEWTYLDPADADPQPQVGQGRHELERAFQRQLAQGLHLELEKVLANGEQVAVVTRTPGLDALRARTAEDRSFDVFTVRHGRIVALRACRDRAEALARAGLA